MAQERMTGDDQAATSALTREPVAPSKPSFPTTGSLPTVPHALAGEDGDIIAPVAQPDSEEILPTAAPAFAADDTVPAAWDDPVHELGASAVRQASLAASGATPVVTVPSPQSFLPQEDTSVRPAWIAGDPRADAPLDAAQWAASIPDYVPAVAAGRATASPGATTGAGANTDRQPDGAEDATASEASATDTEPPLEASTPAPDAPDAQSDGGGDEPPASRDESSSAGTPWYRGAVFLTVVGLLVLGGIAYGVFRALDKPENVAVAAPEVVEVQAEPTLEPVTLKDPSAFLAAMPPTVGPYSMTKAATLDPEKTTLTTRAAEVDDLTYSDGTTTLKLRAIQHYDVADAKAQYKKLAKDGTDPQPVTVGDKKVGQRVTIEGDPTKYVWRNGTAVFVLRGPAEALEGFWIQFPL